MCPVIAAVHGIAFGLAIDMISACDVRYAASDVKFSIKVRDLLVVTTAETVVSIDSNR